jgi:hypothetical protein
VSGPGDPRARTSINLCYGSEMGEYSVVLCWLFLMPQHPFYSYLWVVNYRTESYTKIYPERGGEEEK